MAVRNYSDIGENAMLVVKRLLANQNLMKLLYYTDKEPLDKEDISEEVIMSEIFGTNVKIVPVVGPTETSKSIAVLKFDSFTPNYENSEFKDVEFDIEVFVPLSSWIVKGTNLRPFLIMGEIEKSLKGKTIKGLGKLESIGAELNFLTDEISDYKMTFKLISYD